MSKNFYLFSVICLAWALASCSETEEVGRYDNWKARSEAFIDSIATVYGSAANQALPDTDPEKLYTFRDEVTGRQIYVKKKKNGEGTVSPIHTSTIRAYYRMSYLNGDVVQETYSGAEPGQFGYAPSFSLNSVITGWTYVLIHMKEGDFWTLYIPYQSGYGSGTGGNNSLQAYSALVYDVLLAKIEKQ